MECEDFLEFQDIIKKLRDVDDMIVYALNNSTPVASFRNDKDPTKMCKELFSTLTKNYETREGKIKGCVHITADKVKELKELKDQKPDDSNLIKRLKKEQTKLRLLQTEVNVEEVIRERTFRLFHERCREFYRPPTLPL
ncbi:unnamed protein product [Bemisia tabaci]|uniref:Protein MIX23 n=2 Tax=Bemisia tabaci TaxID=7038 RepID=A0A9P0EY81_BEMTA|nr:unnamed protein product [Bemisia tabaci]